MKKRFGFLLVVCSVVLCLVFAGCTPPSPPPPPPVVSQLSEMRGQIALLTLNPKPSSAEVVEELGFTALMPYAKIVSGWKGKLISIPNRSGVFLRFTADEPDCREHDPQKELEKYKQMKAETPDILVGLVLCPDIGCGLGSKKDWIKVARQVDFISCGIYAWHERYTSPGTIDEDAVKHLEKMYRIISEEIKDTPFVPMLQAHWGVTAHDGNKILEPNVEAQVKYWQSKGFEGYIVYCWSDSFHGAKDMQEEWEEWNKWFLSQIK